MSSTPEPVSTSALDGEAQQAPLQAQSTIPTDPSTSSETISIITYTPEYKDDFRRLNVEWLEKYFRVEPVDVELFAHCERIIEKGGQIWMAVLPDGQCIGTCAILRDGNDLELAKMGVQSDYQRRGVGKMLVEVALKWAKQQPHDMIYLITNSRLTPAIKLYQRFGFSITDYPFECGYERGDMRLKLL